MSTMGSAKRIVYIDVAQACKLLRKLGIVLLFTLIETKVLKQTNIPIAQRSNSCLRRFADGILGKSNWFAKNL